MTWSLTDPGMGLLERAGLAAMYMSLKAADEAGEEYCQLSLMGIFRRRASP